MGLSVQNKVFNTNDVATVCCSLLEPQTIVASARVSKIFRDNKAWSEAREVLRIKRDHSIGMCPSLKTIMAFSGMYHLRFPEYREVTGLELRKKLIEDTSTLSLTKFNRWLTEKGGERNDRRPEKSWLIRDFPHDLDRWNSVFKLKPTITMKDWAPMLKHRKRWESILKTRFPTPYEALVMKQEFLGYKLYKESALQSMAWSVLAMIASELFAQR